MVPGLIVPDPTDKLARRADEMGTCGTAEEEMSEIIKKNLETEKIGIKPGMPGVQSPQNFPFSSASPVSQSLS